jgi:DNA adenine methylase
VEAASAPRREPRLPAAEQSSHTGLEPLFRWPGGKRWLVPTLMGLIPDRFGTYYEPFFGAGALFFALRPPAAVLSDQNAELMACYRAVREEHADVASHLRAFPRSKDGYYEIRAAHPAARPERAARLIYLTTLAFNGIYRVNRLGEFNVPYGGREYPALGSAGSLTAHAAALAAAEILSCDFEVAVASAGRGDLVYLDPPYTVAHSNNGFLRYNERIFSWRDQERLAAVAAELDRRGCHVILSNAAHESVRSLYGSFRVLTISRRSLIAADPSHRQRSEELVLTNAR